MCSIFRETANLVFFLCLLLPLLPSSFLLFGICFLSNHADAAGDGHGGDDDDDCGGDDADDYELL